MKPITCCIAAIILATWGVISFLFLAGDSDTMPMGDFLFYKALAIGNLAAVILLANRLYKKIISDYEKERSNGRTD